MKAIADRRLGSALLADGPRPTAPADVVRWFGAVQAQDFGPAKWSLGQRPQWAGLAIRPVVPDGNDNTTMRLGDDKSVRLPSAEKYSAQVDKEHRWLPTLAAQVPLAIPQPLAKGVPGCGFPRPWSVYRWLPGEHVTGDGITDPIELARDLSRFLTALYQIDPTGGPEPGPHNFSRGGDLQAFDRRCRGAIADLSDIIDAPCATEAWEAALANTRAAPSVWFHGDMNSTNLLVRDGRLSAVIDFGCMGVGDPACDLVIAWTLFSQESREVLRHAMALDEGMWARARGWMLWQALIQIASARRAGASDTELVRLQFGWRENPVRVLEDVLDDHLQHS
ncbi:aminoglycoside phosphotransferase family protein [Actinopolymorpha sp. B11F2]|uniref:aminoglycoside phosphotransferase family protein n=1 Tax=Actinopolymorpha sp. B11F2 TaxID=3160862 RepID=UPI0032E45CB9